MTPHKKFSLIFWIAAGAILLASYYLLDRSQSKLIRSEAIHIAEVVASQVLIDRKIYTEMLVQKLERDGRGAAVNSHKLNGFIPLPAQFVRAVSDDISVTKAQLYRYRLMSEWNINPRQGIRYDFEKDAWQALKQQENEAIKAGLDTWEWQPFVRFEDTAEGLVLRYMQADTASANSCITCHDGYEQRPEIIAMREAGGVEKGKTWQLGQLMGGIHVDVPLSKFEAIAAEDRFSLVMAVFTACTLGFLVLYKLIYLQVIKPVEDEAEAKKSFLAKMSHEIRTPLNAVMNMGEFLKESPLNKEQQQHVRMLDQSAKQLLGIVDDILDFSKVQSGALSVEHIPFDLKELVLSCADSFFIEAMHKGVALEANVAPEIEEYLIGDPVRIRQVLQNLVHNAVKFTEEGEIVISAETCPTGVRIMVEDTGVGIAVDRQKAIFLDFAQGDNSIGRAYGGAGLGLTISKSLVELMGGELKLESAQGVGTKVSFILDLEPASPPKEGEVDLDEAAFHRFEGLRVLVVEDNPLNQMVAKAVLSKWGAIVKIAVDGQKALDRVAEDGVPDVILMDYHMPVMNGLQATRLLRKQGVTIPIIALSAAALEEEVQDCYDAGMDDFLPKPLDRRALNKALIKWGAGKN